jgi:hypothetical protein
MRSVTQSTWFKSLLFFALVLFTAQCGSESEIIVQELNCPALEGFEGGDYLFTVVIRNIVDGCAGGFFNALVLPGPYGPVTLPALGDLPDDNFTVTLPFVGQVTGRLSSNGTALLLTVPDPIRLDDLVTPFGVIDVIARVSGTLCPVSADRLEAAFTVTVDSIDPAIPLVRTPCVIGVPATGTLQ